MARRSTKPARRSKAITLVQPSLSARDVFKLLVCIAASFAAGAIGTLFTVPKIGTWYATLSKPGFSPPDWAFGVAWTILYVLMGVSAFLVWKSATGTPRANTEEVHTARNAFVLQLVLNALWSFAFFGLQNPAAGMLVLFALWLSIAACILAFTRVNRTAAHLLLPYGLWVTYAGALNFAIWTLNP